jgi:hypothetical protein
MLRVSGLASTPVTELAIVICRPSRIHAAPSPATIRVWNGDHPRRSRRAGMRLRIGSWTAAVVLTGPPSSSPTGLARRASRRVAGVASFDPDETLQSDRSRQNETAAFGNNRRRCSTRGNSAEQPRPATPNTGTPRAAYSSGSSMPPRGGDSSQADDVVEPRGLYRWLDEMACRLTKAPAGVQLRRGDRARVSAMGDKTQPGTGVMPAAISSAPGRSGLVLVSLILVALRRIAT